MRCVCVSVVPGLVLTLSLAVLVAPAAADDLRPLYVEIAELDGTDYRVRVKLAPNIPPANAPGVVLPEDCVPDAAGGRLRIYRCTKALYGQTLELRYPQSEPPNTTVVKVFLRSGESHTVALSSGVRQWEMPGPETVGSVAAQYTWLGAEHIWIGFDHLLFLLCLIWIAGSLKRILITITGFTVAHSITLALSALEIIRLPVPPIEAVIALSVVFLASEIVHGPRENLTWRYPVAVSSSFGLLHGLGFAAVLSEIGLPQREVVTGLLFFNVGVEIGQVLFALLVVIGLQVVARTGTLNEARIRLVAGYCVGSLASYWLLERVVAFA